MSPTLPSLARRALLLLALALPGAPLAAPPPTVAAASDVRFAMEEIAAAYRRSGGSAVNVVYGSSGNFFQQIAQDAPFEIFLSADESFVRALQGRQRTVDAGVVYAVGRIALFVPRGSVVKADPQLADLRAAAGDGRLARLAIANPEHAPYGRAARQALQHAGLWEAVQPRLVLGENISQAAQFAASGSAQAGIIALSLAISPNFANAGSYALIPEAWHEPLVQRMVLLRRAGEAARAFYQYLQGPEARQIFRRYGFRLPGEPA